MKRLLLHFGLLLVWGAAGFAVYAGWSYLVDVTAEKIPGDARVVLGAIIAFAAFLGVIIHSKIVDFLTPKTLEVKEKSEEQIQNEAEKRVSLALKEGRKESAIRIYEEAGLFMSALKIAEEIHDIHSMARVSWRMGHFFRARKYLCSSEEL